MKTNFQKIDGRWVVPTGKVVAIGYVNMGDDYDTILADEYKDVCTGETFGKELDEFISDMTGEEIWRLVKSYEEMPEYQHHRKNQKRTRRAARINDMVGTHWNSKWWMYTSNDKKIGKNRFLRRRMHPNKNQLAEFDNWLPF